MKQDSENRDRGNGNSYFSNFSVAGSSEELSYEGDTSYGRCGRK